MFKKFISKQAAGLLCAMFLMAPAPSFAWSHICLELPFWHAWFDAKFKVIYGLNMGELNQINARGEYVTFWHVYKNLSRGSSWWSPKIQAGRKFCSSIHPIQLGEYFAVYLVPGQRSVVDGGIYCTGSYNDRYMIQSDMGHHRRKMWFRATGSYFTPKCRYKNETS